jgi:hypothetical protein
MAAFWAVFTIGGSGPALTAHGSLDLKQEIQIQIQIQMQTLASCSGVVCRSRGNPELETGMPIASR